MTNFSLTPWPRLALLLALLLPGTFPALAQSGITIGATTAPDASAALDIRSTTKGVLLPRVAAASALASPARGLLVFQTGAPAGFYYNASATATPSWQQVATAAGTALTASNGVSVASGNVKLGGTALTATTDVPLAGNSFTFSGTGSVGIGTAAPSGQLEVFSPATISAATPDQSQLSSPTVGASTSTRTYYQSFTAGLSGQLQRIMFSAGGSVGSMATLDVFAGSSPSGSALASYIFGVAAVPFDSPAPVYTVTFPTPATITAGSVYCFRVTISSGTLVYYNAAPGTTYAGGASNLPGNVDVYFQTQVTQPLPPATALLVKGSNVGIGTSTPSFSLDVTGTVRATGSITANSYVTTSDQRLKTDVRPLRGALAGVLALRGVRYQWNALGVQRGGAAGAGQVGLLAQEVEAIYPELVSTGPDGYKAVNYAQLTPVLIEAIRELQQQNAALQARTAQADADHASLCLLQAQMAHLLGTDARAQK